LVFTSENKIVEYNDAFNRNNNIYSNKIKAGKRRTYFFDVKQTKGNDYFITLTECTKKFNSEETERHKIFVYKEDFNRFLQSLQDTIDYVKTELMPDYDFDEFASRQDVYDQNLSDDGENK